MSLGPNDLPGILFAIKAFRHAVETAPKDYYSKDAYTHAEKTLHPADHALLLALTPSEPGWVYDHSEDLAGPDLPPKVANLLRRVHRGIQKNRRLPPPFPPDQLADWLELIDEVIEAIKPVEDADGNSLTRTGDIWTIRYGAEKGTYKVKGNKCIGWLVQLLVRPNRSLTAADLRGNPQNEMTALAGLRGDPREASAAGTGLGAVPSVNVRRAITIKKRLDEIKDAIQETGGSESLENEQINLLQQLEEISCDREMAKPAMRQHHNIASQLRNFFKKLVDGMPALASHLNTFIDLDYPHFRYSPPDRTSAWKT